MPGVGAGSWAGAIKGAADQKATHAATTFQNAVNAELKQEKKGQDYALALI